MSQEITPEQIHQEIKISQNKIDVLHRSIQKSLDEIEGLSRYKGQMEVQLNRMAEEKERAKKFADAGIPVDLEEIVNLLQEKPVEEDIEDVEPILNGIANPTD